MKNFVSFVKDKLKEKDKNILSCSGKFLYSSAQTLKPGKVYLLGYNPGGVPGNETIENDLDKLHTQDNSYTDEKWEWGGKELDEGKHPLQKRVIHLLKSLGEEPEEVCASNLIFKRSENQKGVKHKKDANTCWHVHKRILQIVKPKKIVAFGLGTYYYLKGELGKNNEEFICNSGYKNRWGIIYCKSFKFESDSGIVVVVGLPHLSRYKIYQHVINWIEGGCKHDILDIN